MSKVFKANEFIDKLKHIATLPTIYYSGGNKWSSWNGTRWRFDCVVSIKSVLWGWCENKKAEHGGAKYGSNGVKDFTCNGGLNYCSGVSQNFTNLIPGEYLCMKGTQYNHSGIYLGNGKVFEVTTAWSVNGATISDIDTKGNRSRNKKKCLKWTYHGKLNYIDYSEEPINVNVYYRVKTKKYGWLPEVKNLNDYAGWKDDPIIDVAVKVDKGSIKYQVHNKKGNWLPYVTGYNIKDFNNGYAGNDKEIDLVKIVYTDYNKKAKYRVNDSEWKFNETAGITGKNVTKLEVIIV